MTLYLWFCVEFLKFSIFSFFVMDWFFVVSTSLFKGAFTDSAMHLFSFIVSLFVHYVGNVALIRRRVSGLFVQLQLFFDYFFIFIDNWFDICTKLFLYYSCWIFHGIFGCWENDFELFEGNIYRCCFRRSLKNVSWTRWCFFCDLRMIYFYFYSGYLVICEDINYFIIRFMSWCLVPVL